MTVQQVTDPRTPIGDVLSAADSGGVLIESNDREAYALLRLNDDLIDHLLEHDPRFIRECEQIRQRMRAGQFRTHEQVKRLLADESRDP